MHAYYYNEFPVRLAEEINSIVPGEFEKRVSFGLSGSDANDTALKLVRFYTKRQSAITFTGSYHGQTYGGLSLSAIWPQMQESFGPLVPGIFHVPYANCYRCEYRLSYPGCGLQCARKVRETIQKNDVAGVFVEPIQGDAGVIIPPSEFLPEIRRVCSEFGVLYVDEEVQTGFGRTGKMLGIEYSNVVPDVVVFGKALASGICLSAVVAKAEIMTWPPGSHFFTPAANPMACAAALATLDVIRKMHLPEHAERVGQGIMKRLREMQDDHEIIGDVRGKGLMIGVELVKDRKTKEPAKLETGRLSWRAFERGLAVSYYGTYSNVLRIAPPLILTEKQADRAVNILEESLKDVETGKATRTATGW
jgi:4-aminobutyrate aminotransferase